MKSLLSRLTFALCLAALILLPAGGLIVYYTAHTFLEANFDAVLEAKADALLTTAEVKNGRVETDFEVQAFAGFGSAAAGDYFEFRSPKGDLLARSPSLKRDRLPPPAQPPGRRPEASYIKLPDGREGRILWQAMPLASDDGAPDVVVELGVATDSINLKETFRTLGTVLGMVSGLGLVVTLVLLRRVLKYSLQPLKDMARDVQSIEVEKPNDVLAYERLPSELVPVGLKVNELLTRARQSLERERSFSSHAAHELRTPLAELRAMTDLMSLWTDEVTPARCEEMQAVIERLESLLQKLSLLARADAGQQPVRLERLNLASSVSAAVERFAEAALDKNLRFHTNTHGTELVTDPVLWNAIIDNLLENAVSYGAPDSEISVEAGPTHLKVSNDAPRLNSSDLERMTDRFWRKEDADASELIQHSGLGLALVATYVRLLGGVCDFRLDEGAKRLTVEVRWTRSA